MQERDIERSKALGHVRRLENILAETNFQTRMDLAAFVLEWSDELREAVQEELSEK